MDYPNRITNHEKGKHLVWDYNRCITKLNKKKDEWIVLWYS